MNKHLLFVILAFSSLIAVSSGQSSELQSPQVKNETADLPDVVDTIKESKELPGVALSESLSEITGIAISPLLGVSASGAWKYFHTPDNLRDSLPWYCAPMFWGAALFFLGLFSLKTILPNVLSKPLDILDTFEDKISAAVVAVGVVPNLVSQTVEAFPASPQLAHITNSDIVLASIHFDYRIIFLPLGIAAFLVVWMTSHAINLLIVLSPFAVIDLGLKLLKMFLMAVVLVSYLIHPILGAAVSLSFIAVATYLAPRVFRFSFFVSLLSFDLITPWRAKKTTTPKKAHAFISLKSLGAPKHTYGRIQKDEDGSLLFTYRPRLILKTKKIKIEGSKFVIRKGVLHPALLRGTEHDGVFDRILILPPRYRKSEHLVAEHLPFTDVVDNSSIKGIKAVKSWFKDMISEESNKVGDVRSIHPELNQ